jgi:hypothetical protein
MGMRGNTVVAFLIAAAAALLTGESSATAAADKNACGCYRNESSGACFCDKKAKCGCPGECEPKGCEEQREKQLQKEIDAETKRAAENERHKKSEGAKPEKSDEDRGGSAAAEEEAPAKPAPPPPAPSGKKLNGTQMKQLAKLLDQYLGEHPEARGKTTEELRNELSLVPR